MYIQTHIHYTHKNTIHMHTQTQNINTQTHTNYIHAHILTQTQTLYTHTQTYIQHTHTHTHTHNVYEPTILQVPDLRALWSTTIHTSTPNATWLAKCHCNTLGGRNRAPITLPSPHHTPSSHTAWYTSHPNSVVLEVNSVNYCWCK